MKKKLEKITREDGRFSVGAVKFVYDGLGYTAKKMADEPPPALAAQAAPNGGPSYVSGQTLCKGLKRLAIKKWGRLAMLVLNTWGIKTTRDFGEIVYLMIKHKWMSVQPADSIDDFNDVYDFKTAFKDQFKF